MSKWRRDREFEVASAMSRGFGRQMGVIIFGLSFLTFLTALLTFHLLIISAGIAWSRSTGSCAGSAPPARLNTYPLIILIISGA